jgi:hypothetical protein
MRKQTRIKWISAFFLSISFCGSLCAQSEKCGDISIIAKMARARSAAQLIAQKSQAGDSYRARVVFAARELELKASDKRAASMLLDLIPKDDDQKTTWMTFGSSLCDAEPIADMVSLGSLGDRLSRDLARAVLLVPNRMPAYVTYADEAVQDPHNDYAVQMQTVCHKNHSGFTKTINGLPEKEKDWFVKHILNPVGCHALALPEAE